MIKLQQYGKHENVLIAEFGTGDICFTRGRRPQENYESELIFVNHEQRPIGSESSEWAGKTSDDIPRPEIVFVFRKPESITALIHSLIELQKEVFKLSDSDKQPTSNDPSLIAVD